MTRYHHKPAAIASTANSKSPALSNSLMGETSPERLGTYPKPLGKVLHEIAGYAPGVGYTKQAIGEAAKRTGIPYWRTFDIWYGKARRIEQHEIEAIDSALDKKRREVTRNELHSLKTRIALLEARLAQTDSEFHRETIDALGNALRGAR